MNELAFLKELAQAQGYRFERDRDGTERMIRPDGTVAVIAQGNPDAIVLSLPPDAPAGTFIGGDGAFYQQIDGQTIRICEDCYQAIPPYIDFPRGLVSPESDGDAGGNFAKIRTNAIPDSGKLGVEHVPKVVCLTCYLAAFARVYPDAPAPELRPDVKITAEVYQPDAVEEIVYVPEPKTQAHV